MASRRALSLSSRQLEQAATRSRCTSLKPSTIIAFNLQCSMPRLRQPKRHFTTSLVPQQESSSSSSSGTSKPPHIDSGIPPSKIYTFAEVQDLSSAAEPNRVIIDVREPSELLSTGQIPGSRNIPISSAPDAFFLPPDEFEDKYGFPRPGKEDEVVFYCKAGVRSRAAARLAGQSGFGGKVGEFPGSWIEWAEKGGEVQK